MPMTRGTSTSLLSRSGPAIAVIALHIALIYAVVVSTGVVKVPQFAEPLQTVFIDDPAQSEPEPEPVKPEIEQMTPVEQPMPELQFEEIPAPPTDVAMPPSDTAIAATPTEGATAQQLKTTNRVEPVYPATSRRMGEEGTVRVRVLVDERGRPTTVNVMTSSGFSRLDQAALEAVKRWRFVAATDGNRPIQTWTQVAITFKLTDAQRASAG
jgi:protein TonB